MRASKYAVAVLIMTVCPALMFGGTISGKVTYTGTPVKQKPIDMSKEPSCAKQHTPPITTETVVAGANNTLDNVVVYISAGADEANAPAQAVTFDQKGCQYIPHVVALHTGPGIDQVVNATRLRTTSTRWRRSTASGISRSLRVRRRSRRSSTSKNSFR